MNRNDLKWIDVKLQYTQNGIEYAMDGNGMEYNELWWNGITFRTK